MHHTQGLEQHGRAAGGAKNSPVGCFLVRGDQSIGMSIGETVNRQRSFLRGESGTRTATRRKLREAAWTTF